MIKIKKSSLPKESLAEKQLPIDYTDCYKCTVDNIQNVSADDILINLWTDMPRWIDMLFRLRHVLVKIVGLKGDNENSFESLENCIRTGAPHPIMSVTGKSENETVISMSDKHLTAYISVYVDEKKNNIQDIYTGTLVKFHRPLGYIYFYAIYPFHHIVVRYLMKHILKKLRT